MKRVTAELDRADRLQLLDLLRFAAALSVMIYHLTYRPRFLGEGAAVVPEFLQGITCYGYLGLELFFMISGFVVLWSASGRSVSTYIISRLSRLAPSLWLAIFTTSAALALFGRDNSVLSIKAILANMVLVNSFFDLPYIDGVYWTLKPEIKFYSLILLVILIRQTGRIDYWLTAWLAGSALAFSSVGPEWLKSIVIFPYGTYFISGSLFFLMWRDGLTRRRVLLSIISFVLNVLCVIEASAEFVADGRSVAHLAVGATVVMLFHLLFFMISLRKVKLPLSTIWSSLGMLTYPLYLLHNQIGKAVAASLAGRIGPGAALWLGILVPLGLALLFAQLTEKKGCPWLRRVLSETVRRVRKSPGRSRRSALSSPH